MIRRLWLLQLVDVGILLVVIGVMLSSNCINGAIEVLCDFVEFQLNDQSDSLMIVGLPARADGLKLVKATAERRHSQPMAKIPQPLSLNPDEHNGYLDALLTVITADNILDSDEVVKIYELFAILGIRSGRRRQILESIIAQPEAYSSQSISSSILANQTLSLALAKDLMLLKESSKDNASRLLAAQYLESINLSGEQLDVLNRFIMIEREILASLSVGKEWMADEKSWKELVSRAVAVGVPLAALNIAGVDGLNAVEISSGLAALGSMSGLASLGLNSMSAGIGVLILGGVAAKKIASLFMSSEDSDKRSQLEAFKAARATAKQAITSDLLTVARARKREFIRPRRRHRRAVLRASMIESITRLSS